MKIIDIIQIMTLSILLVTSCTTTETTSTEKDTITTEVTNPKPNIPTPTLTELEQNSDIIWMGEIQVDYALDYNHWDYNKEDQKRILMDFIL